MPGSCSPTAMNSPALTRKTSISQKEKLWMRVDAVIRLAC
jgi:hypothetical protein